ncbi:MAG: hypothetical protein N2Z75_09545 [Meiothermus sp.]|nr:hypothetical protein [Meiothermus sp.]
MPILQTPEDVIRVLRRNPGREYDLYRPGRKPPIRIYARPSGTIVLWQPHQSRPISVVYFTTYDIGEGPYELRPI